MCKEHRDKLFRMLENILPKNVDVPGPQIPEPWPCHCVQMVVQIHSTQLCFPVAVELILIYHLLDKNYIVSMYHFSYPRLTNQNENRKAVCVRQY